MENWATRLNNRTKHEAIYPSISQKIHWQTEISFSSPRILQTIRGDGAILVKRGILQSPITTLPLFKADNAPPSALVRSPLENPELSALLKLAAFLCFLKISSAPFERVKLLLQSQNEIIKSGRLSKPYNGIYNCFATTIRTEGFFSLWRGCVSMAIGSISSRAISLALNKYFASHLEHEHWNYFQNVAAKGLFSAGILYIIYPFLYAGTRLANDVKTTSGTRQFNGMFDVYRKTLKSDGIAGIYRGYNVSLAQLVVTQIASSALMPLQEFWFLVLQGNVWGLVAASCGFRVCRNLGAYPLDTVSKRMMMRSGEAVKYKSSVNAFAQILRREGVKSLYKGAGADIVLNVAFSGIQALVMIPVMLRAAMDNSGDDDDDSKRGGSTFTITWKKLRGD